MKAIQPEEEKEPALCLYTDSWMVANAQCRWLQQWKNWQGRDKPTWAAALWPDTTAWVENMTLKGHHADTDVPKSRATQEH